MTFKGDTIVGKPTLAMIEIHIAEKGLFCNPKDCMSYWENKQWLTHKGVEPKTLESAIDSYNSIAVQKFVQRNQKLIGISKVKQKGKKKAKSALAMARISQIMANDIENFGGVVSDREWENGWQAKYCITRRCNKPYISINYCEYAFLAFHTEQQCDLFLEKYPQLVKDYLMISDEETK